MAVKELTLINNYLHSFSINLERRTIHVHNFLCTVLFFILNSLPECIIPCSEHETLKQCWFNADPPATQLIHNICIPFCTTSAQRLSNIVQMVSKCFVCWVRQNIKPTLIDSTSCVCLDFNSHIIFYPCFLLSNCICQRFTSYYTPLISAPEICIIKCRTYTRSIQLHIPDIEGLGTLQPEVEYRLLYRRQEPMGEHRIWHCVVLFCRPDHGVFGLLSDNFYEFAVVAFDRDRGCQISNIVPLKTESAN